MPEYTLSDEETIDEVRNALAGLSSEHIPDDTILFSVNNIAEPWVTDQSASGLSQTKYEAAIHTYGAELSFAAWNSISRQRDVELEVYKNPRVYRDKLEQRTDQSLSIAGITRPPRRKHFQKVVDP